MVSSLSLPTAPALIPRPRLAARAAHAGAAPDPRHELAFTPLSEASLAFFEARKIGPATLQRNRVLDSSPYRGSLGRCQLGIAFPYLRRGEVVGVKYRSPLEKTFWRTKGGESILYGLDDVTGAPEVILVEGEMDKLAMEEAGLAHCASVPAGAPDAVSKGGLPPPATDRACVSSV